MSAASDRWKNLANVLPDPDLVTQNAPHLSHETLGKDRETRQSDNFIILPGNGVTINDCAIDLFSRIAEKKAMFQRGGAIVKLASGVNGKLRLMPVSPAAFRSEIEHHGRTYSWRMGAGNQLVLKPTPCPEDTAKALMASQAALNLLPPISMITDCPILVEKDGLTDVLKKGYHRDLGGLLVTTGADPAHWGPQKGAIMLSWLIHEFDFKTPGDRARAFAMLLTPAMKMGGILTGNVPITLVEANLSQSGKTYFAKILAALYGEHPSIVPLRNGGVGSVDESFAQALVNGRPFVLFDNFRGRLDSPYLEAFLTANGSFPARIPHCGNIQIDPERFILMMTSNGVEITPDLANRACIIRIRKREGFQFRSQPEGDLLSFVQANQRQFLGSIFGIISSWVSLGKPTSQINDHDFRTWAQSLDWICQTHGFGPLLADHHGAQTRVSNPSLTFCRNVAITVVHGEHCNRRISASDLCTICENSGIGIPGLVSGDRGAASRQIGKLMSNLFGDKDVVCIEGFEVRRIHSTEKREGGGDYPGKFYQFNILPHAPK